MTHLWDTEKYIWSTRMHPINVEFKGIAFFRLSPGQLKQCLWQPRWSRKKAGDELKCPWSPSWELTCSQNSEIPQQLHGTLTATEVHSLVKLSPCWVSCMNLEAKARISWGKCSTQMEPETLCCFIRAKHMQGPVRMWTPRNTELCWALQGPHCQYPILTWP